MEEAECARRTRIFWRIQGWRVQVSRETAARTWKAGVHRFAVTRVRTRGALAAPLTSPLWACFPFVRPHRTSNTHGKDCCWGWNWCVHHLVLRANSLEKTLMPGKIEGKRRRQQKMRWLDGITAEWTWIWANSRRQWKTGKAGMLQPTGS